jgi:SAM-dependent methyltransferase
MDDERDWAAVFEATFAGPVSPVQVRVWRSVLGDEYPEGLDAHSYVTVTELRRFANELAVTPDGVFADVGCGRGGPGLWIAAATGAAVVGVDIAEAALAAARARAAAVGLAQRARYQIGSFSDTGLSDTSVDGIMSVDALLFAADKQAALAELARVLRPGGRLVLTSWDYRSQPAGRPPQVADHRPLLRDAGFDVIAYEDTDNWYEIQERIGRGLLDAVDELAHEAGEEPASVRSQIEEMKATQRHMIRRFIAVAARRA